ncbi:MAG: undecaprenyl-phosphate galactose phosphotransferase WbaP [Acidaminococcaceae bacterium]|nr:undecaprenyl-phosphate galactose phosphotransferase WbaP [Acidaminococcaceae bacterium]
MSEEIAAINKKNTIPDSVAAVYKYAYILIPLLLVFFDYCAVLCAEEVAMGARNFIVPFLENRMLSSSGGVFHVSELSFYVITPALYIIFLQIFGLYTGNMQSWRVISNIFKANLYTSMTGVFILYVIKAAEHTSRLYLGLLCMAAFFFTVLFRYVIKMVLRKINFGEPVLLIGAGNTAAYALTYFKAEMGTNYRFVGYLEDYEPHPDVKRTLPWLGGFADAAAVIRKIGVQKVLVTAPGLTQEKIQNIVYELQPFVKNISFIPDLGSLPLSTMKIEHLADGHAVVFQVRNNLKNKANRFLKFAFDWFLTFVGTICILPILFAIGLWIYFDSPGPIIFKHRRVGKDGKEFNCYKFRSMCVDADVKLKELLEKDPEARAEWEKDFKLKNDPRITKSGDFLRRTSLDELPQIFNVLKGEMSLVGPRPIIQDEVPRYGKYIDDYYMVRPGITGIWQTSGRSDVDYDERVQMDTWYVRNWNIWFDIVLLWRTFSVVLGQKGAY